MVLPSPLAAAYAQGRLLLLWAALPFPLADRAPAERAALLRRLAAGAAGLPPAAELPRFPPLPILSLDPSDRVARAFAAAGVPLRVVRGRRDAPAAGGHNLFPLAGDLAARRAVVLSREEARAVLSDPDRRYLLEEAVRPAAGGALLLLGADPASADLLAWWEALAPYRSGLACCAVGSAAAPWPADVSCLGPDAAAVAAALALVERSAAPRPPETGAAESFRELDYERGLAALRAGLAAADPKTKAELATLEARFRQNERDERLFGSSETTRHTRAQVVHALNTLALAKLRRSFTALCAGD